MTLTAGHPPVYPGMMRAARPSPVPVIGQRAIALAVVLGSAAAWAGGAPSGQPHRPEGRLPGYLVAVEATRLAPCAEPTREERPCLDVGLHLSLAADAEAARRSPGRGAAGCAVSGALTQLLAAAPVSRAPLRGISRRLRLDDGALIRWRHLFGDRLKLVLDAVRRRLVARKREGPHVERVAAAGLLERLEGAPHYRVRRDVVLPSRVERWVAELARAFYQRRGRRLTITSGTRSPRLQARAMYTKLRAGGRTRGLYRKWRAAGRIERVYRRMRARGRRRGRSAVIAAMTAEIESQVAQGVFVSPHLQAGAVDLRSRGLRRRDRRALLGLAHRAPWVCQIKLERRPPHFHLRFAGEDGGCEADDRDMP